MALLEAMKESIWVQRLLSKLGHTAVKNVNVIYEDNQGAIAFAYNPEHPTWTKHIDIQFQFLSDCVENGKVKLKYCPTSEMVADPLTKPLSKDKHYEMMERMRLEEASVLVTGK